MSTYRAPWALCGGWAVDAWLGRQTREHGDVDITVSAQDLAILFDHLSGWQMVAHGHGIVLGDASELWDGRPLDPPAHLHARPDTGEALPDGVVLTAEQGFALDIMIDDQSGGEWTLSSEPRIVLPLRNCVRRSAWGLPTAVPEVLLFFKAGELRRRDRLDFLALLPRLTRKQRHWLRNAVALVGHPWLPQLAE
jgi:hypothetical protein